MHNIIIGSWVKVRSKIGPKNGFFCNAPFLGQNFLGHILFK